MNYITQFSSLGVIRASGPDAEKFLQGQFTCDMREITAEHHSLGAYCNLQGRVIATFRIFKSQQDYYLLIPTSMANTLIEMLKKYIIMAKVKLEDVSEQFACIGLAGPLVSQKLQSIYPKIPLTTDESVQIDNITLLKMPREEDRFLVIGENTAIKNLADLLQKEFTDNHEKTNEEYWQQLDILGHIPTIYPETSGLFTPHMLNLPALNAVSFKKGCYVGQEIIARTEYLGKTKRHLQLIEINRENTFKPGDKFFNEQQQEIGIVVNACSDLEKTYLLIVGASE